VVELIVHCAAETNFAAPFDPHQSVNVEGTRDVVCFARASRGSFANSYEASKAMAEKLVRASGLRAAVARPSIIAGTSDTGAIRRFENLYAFLRLIGAGRITLLPAIPDASLDFVPIDPRPSALCDVSPP